MSAQVVRKGILGALAVALVLGTAAVAGSGSVAFAAPGSWGPVDFGDQVAYRLEGPGCSGAEVSVAATGGRRSAVKGPVSRALRDPLAPGVCVGVAVVPGERQVRGGGWDAGDPLDLALVSGKSRQPLRYQRLETELGTAAAGTPTVLTPATRDTRGGRRDRAVELDGGDVVSLGRVDLSRIHSVSMRVCMVLPKPHLAPTFVEIRATAPDGPSVVGPVDVNDDVNNSYKSNYGWPDCWQLQTWPVTGEVPGRAPELFLAVTTAAGGPVQVSYVDVNGSGAKVVNPPASDPAGTRQVFDGTSFDGWEQSGCALDEGAARPVHSRDPRNYAAVASAGFVGESGCSMTYTARKLDEVVIRLDYRLQDYGDNGGVFLGGHEIQLREAGEWLTGGFLGSTVPAALTQFAVDNAGGYPAQRIKSNTYPDWSRMEIVQLGGRFIVRINGRTVTDCRDCAPDPGPFDLRLASQPGFSYQYGVNGRFDSTTNPDVMDPSDWGNVSFRNVRVYDCRGPADPVCAAGPGVTG